MKFSDFFKASGIESEDFQTDLQESKPVQVDLTPDQILSNAGYKIKSRILTDFGIQYTLFKKIDSETLKQLGETREKGNLIFVFN